MFEVAYYIIYLWLYLFIKIDKTFFLHVYLCNCWTLFKGCFIIFLHWKRICWICDFTTGLGFGNTGLTGQTGFGTSTSAALTLGPAGQQAFDPTAAAIAQQNQQQLLQLTSSPYGDSPLFRNLRHVRSVVSSAFFMYFVRLMWRAVCLEYIILGHWQVSYAWLYHTC